MNWTYFRVYVAAAMLLIALMVGVLVGLLGRPGHPAASCQEDGAWVAVDHHALDATEDTHGVSRACRNIDDLIDSGIEVWIQNQ